MAAKDNALTPMMVQFYEVKKTHPDSILFFRMGDFYEMFGEDAVTASKILGITLTSRNKNSENQQPMCGVPHHAYKQYAVKLIQAGYKVAVCDQLEDPAIAKGIVKRGVTRVITPGTMMDEEELSDASNNFLVAIYLDSATQNYYIAAADVSTGELYLCTANESSLFHAVMSFTPTEILTSTPLRLEKSQQRETLSPRKSINMVTTFFKRSSVQQLGLYDELLAVPLAMILTYIDEALLNVSFSNPVVLADADRLILDEIAASTLELVKSNNGKGNTLFEVLNYTSTAMGQRMLKWWILHPLKTPVEINKRLDIVELFVKYWNLTDSLRSLLKEVNDIERIASRVSSGRVNPKELIALKNSLLILPRIFDLLSSMPEFENWEYKQYFYECEIVASLIEQAIDENPEVTITSGGIIRAGYNQRVDEFRTLKENGRSMLAALESNLKKETGINQLKVSYNKVFGYYIEVSKGNLSKVPESFERKQTLVNAERFVTPELKELENRILNAEDMLSKLEHDIFCNIRNTVQESVASLRLSAKGVAVIDTYTCLAVAAATRGYNKPLITEDFNIDIKAARHPVVEAKNMTPFVSNDLLLDNDENRLLIITGPNMSGKSTYIRSAAIVVLMAHMGSFVPADSAIIGSVDRIFTRVGASDNISRGESTFMVEMVETANILNNATDRSLIILDEIGRGTSTYDGLSIAWAISEYLLKKIKARTLFATHYHELTEISSIEKGVRNYTVLVKEQNSEVIFMHKILPGAANKSYGIYVGGIAGLPAGVIKRAEEVLAGLESTDEQPKAIEHKSPKEYTVKEQILVFEENPAVDILKNLDINSLTPMQALATLENLKKIATDS